MSVTMPRIILLAGLLSLSSLWSNSSWALGLGEIHLNSALNEPMNAEIDIIAATPDELNALRATLAPRDAFTRYGIDRPPFLSTFTFKVGKSKDGRDVLLVRSADAIPEPFVTFLVDVNWARGHLMREYTVLLDPPVYTPGENAGTSAPVTAPSSAPAAPAPPPARTSAASTAPEPAAPSVASPTPTAPPPVAKGRRSRSHRAPAPASEPAPAEAAAPPAPVPAAPAETAAPGESQTAMPATVTVVKGDTLTKIARALHAETPADIDQTMIALYRANPKAFASNINVLRQGAVLRVPGADEIAALNQKEAMGEVHRQMDAWRAAGGASAETGGHLRLVTPSAGGSGAAASSTPASAAGSGEDQALRERVKDLENQLAESKRLIDIRNAELAELQHKLGVPSTATPPPPVKSAPAQAQPLPPPPQNAAVPTQAQPPPPAAQPETSTPPPQASAPPPPVHAKPPLKKPAAAPAAASGSWLDWVEDNWQVPLAVILAVIAALGFVAWRKRKQSAEGSMNDLGSVLDETHISDMNESAAKLTAMRNRGNESIVVEESGQHPAPDFTAETGRFGDTGELRTSSPEDTMSSESAVNLDQGDPLAEADFHMAYGLYDQAADLVRIALEREPERRDLRMKLLEIYFVWGNKDAFLQTAKELAATRDRAPAGEWEKIVIMGKQICPGEALFTSTAGSGRGAGALVDLNLEGGENRVDIDLFGEPEGEHASADHGQAKVNEDTATTSESPQLKSGSDLDFTLDTPERGADDTSAHAAQREEPTIEAELMNLADAPTTESPVLKTTEMRPPKMPAQRADETAEVPIDDLGLNLDQLETTGSASSDNVSPLEETDHPADAPTMVAGLDERSRRMMEEAAKNARDRDLTELERELEASFIADLEVPQEEIKTAVLPPESAPTVLMPREQKEAAQTLRVKSSPEFSDIRDPDKIDIDSTSKLRGINADSIDLDLDRLATALGSGDTVEQPRAAEEVFSSEVFEASQRSRRVDLDVGEAMNGSEHPTNKFQVSTSKLKAVDLPIPELEPVTMSEVGTKLDLARAYMDMGDPEGARSILEEVVQEGSASQKQEASRLIESLPG
ncbi:MAG TPA: FimV/HubP family polar landmark protein [Steroidobacteraceae bacterium]|nr:FimV/HubP family polar landmark protein [Steroidobacteraceae bacterium]